MDYRRYHTIIVSVILSATIAVAAVYREKEKEKENQSLWYINATFLTVPRG